MNKDRAISTHGISRCLRITALAGCLTALACGALGLPHRVAPAYAAGTPAGFKSYADTALHYRIAYPASWQKRATPGLTMFLGPRAQGTTTSVVILSYAETLLSADAIANTFVKKQHHVKITGRMSTSIGGADARIITAQQMTGTHQSVAIVAFVSHSRTWIITYASSPRLRTQTWSQFRSMLASFSFL